MLTETYCRDETDPIALSGISAFVADYELRYNRIRRLKLPAPRERMQPLQSFFNDECQCNKPIDFAAPAALGPPWQCIYYRKGLP